MTLSPPVAPTQHIVLLQALLSAPDRLELILLGWPESACAWRPAPEAWNALETMAHLAAADPLFQARLTRILREENPWLPWFGPDVARPEADRPARDLMQRVRAARDQLAAFLSTLTPHDWQRRAVHQTMGATTLAQQVQNVINHDGEHLDQLRDLRRRWEADGRRHA